MLSQEFKTRAYNLLSLILCLEAHRLLHQPMFLHLVIKVILKLFGTLKILSVGRVVQAAVGEDSIHIGFEEVSGDVVSKMKLQSSTNSHKPTSTTLPGLDSLAHRLEIHRVLNVIVIVRYFSHRDRLQEWPTALVVLHQREDVVKLNGENFRVVVFLKVSQVLWRITRWHLPSQLT